MRLALGLVVGALVAFAMWCIDPGEYAAWPRLNSLQNLLGYSIAAFFVIWGLGYNFEFLRPLVEGFLRAAR